MGIIHKWPLDRNKNTANRTSSNLRFEDIIREAGGKIGIHDIACPWCGGSCKSAANRRRKVMRVWHLEPGFATFSCARCGEKGFVRDGDRRPPDPVVLRQYRAEAEERERVEKAIKLETALWLWSQRFPVEDSIAERYLRKARGYGGAIPSTLGFLPERGDHPPAMIGAFGLAHEVEPGVIAIADEAVVGVHLTRLAPDGSDRDRGPGAKIMIGRSAGWPLVVAPPNDLLGLAITEGIEDGLSVHEATGLGVWVAGCASRMPALADILPSYLNSVTVIADCDPDGLRNAEKLVHRIKGLETFLSVPSRRAAA
jgi:hypothetical protein